MKQLPWKLGSAVVDVPALLRNGNAATNGAGADISLFAGATVQFHSGTLTDGSIACKLQDSLDNSVWTDVAGSQVVGGVNLQTLAATDDNTVKELGYLGSQPLRAGRDDPIGRHDGRDLRLRHSTRLCAPLVVAIP